MEDGAKKKFKEMSEDNARRKTHFSFGKYINARWHIQDGSRLTLWFQSNKIYNTDDMIDCIIATYHRSLNNQPLQFEQLAEYYFKTPEFKNKYGIPEKYELVAPLSCGYIKGNIKPPERKPPVVFNR